MQTLYSIRDARRAVTGIATAGLVVAMLTAIAPAAEAAPIEAGSEKTGKTYYPAPKDALYVSPTGSDSNAGTWEAPFKTLQRAIDLAPAGRTIVMRGGMYYGQTAGISREVTIQAAAGEPVWIDGSEPLSGGWVEDGSVWYRDGFTTHFDCSPTYTQGAPDGTVPGWIFIDPNYPMAAHPEQIFIDGYTVNQVASKDQVTKGTFYIDYAAQRIYIGDDPTGAAIVSSNRQRFLQATAKVTLRGVDIRRYAPSVPHMGAIYIAASANGSVLENVHVEDISTTAISVSGPNTTLRNITVLRSGFTGIHAHEAHNLLVDRVAVVAANRERFNQTPAAAGMKITGSRNVTVRSSVFTDNYATGLWADQTVYNLVVVGCEISRNRRFGLVDELGHKALIANNRIRDNYRSGITIANTGAVEIWNNSILGSPAPIYISQDDRRPRVNDPWQPFPDLVGIVTWVSDDVIVKNNIIGLPAQGGAVTPARPGYFDCGLLCVTGQVNLRPGEQMRVLTDGNVFHRTAESSPQNLITWTDTQAYTTLAAYRAAELGGDTRSVELVGTSPVGHEGLATAAVTAQTSAVAVGIPAYVAAATPALPWTWLLLGAQP